MQDFIFKEINFSNWVTIMVLSLCNFIFCKLNWKEGKIEILEKHKHSRKIIFSSKYIIVICLTISVSIGNVISIFYARDINKYSSILLFLALMDVILINIILFRICYTIKIKKYIVIFFIQLATFCYEIYLLSVITIYCLCEKIFPSRVYIWNINNQRQSTNTGKEEYILLIVICIFIILLLVVEFLNYLRKCWIGQLEQLKNIRNKVVTIVTLFSYVITIITIIQYIKKPANFILQHII